MLAYLEIDLHRTMQVYKKQKEQFETNPRLSRLFHLACQDLLVLAEMEWNGLLLDVNKAEVKRKELAEELEDVDRSLNNIYPHIPINWNSGDHISAVLYGGTITSEDRELIGVYKSGEKLGQPRFRVNVTEHTLKPLCKPIKGSELAKEGFFSTAEDTLKQLKGAKRIVTLLLERARLSKELDYFIGLPELLVEKDWEGSTLHGQLNQCVAQTGRLSASAPNQQNLSDAIKQCIVSRF